MIDFLAWLVYIYYYMYVCVNVMKQRISKYLEKIEQVDYFIVNYDLLSFLFTFSRQIQLVVLICLTCGYVLAVCACRPYR